MGRSWVHERLSGVEHHLSVEPAFPPRPHGPMGACTHSSTNVQFAQALTSTAQRCTRTQRLPAGKQDSAPVPAPGCIQACELWRGERNRQTPGDHATNLGYTMLVLLRMALLAYFLGRLGTQ